MAILRPVYSILIVSLLLVGCSSETDLVSPEANPREALLQAQGSWQGKAELGDLWPNADQSRWRYDLLLGFCRFTSPSLFDSPADVPPAPSIEEIAALLDRKTRKPPKDGAGTPIICLGVRGMYELKFDGTTTTTSGVSAQNLVWSYEDETVDGSMRLTEERGVSLFSRLKEARPDLLPALRALGPAAEETPPRSLTLFLPTGAWEKSEEGMVLYGDADQNPIWQYLTSYVKPRSHFVFQLVPALADDVFLHAKILSRSQERKPTVFKREIEVVYMLDYGILAVVGPGGGPPLGYTRFVDYGSVVYAPGYGPVASHERLGATSDDFRNWTRIVFLFFESFTPGGGFVWDD
jgi:hypothetical protein